MPGGDESPKRQFRRRQNIYIAECLLIRYPGFMIRFRHQQPTLWAGFLAEEVEDLWEPWMRHADRVLADEALIAVLYEAQGGRHARSRNFGRPQTPAEVVLRLLLLKHIRNWSFDELEREVRANLVYRSFARIGTEKVPDAKTLARLCREINPAVIQQLHERIVELAREEKVVQGRKLRVDTTVVETNVHYPTDSSLLGDGARVLTRTMKKMEARTGGLTGKVRDRMRSDPQVGCVNSTGQPFERAEGRGSTKEAVP